MNEKILLVIGYVIPLVPSIVFSVPGVSYQVASATEFITFGAPLIYLGFVYGKIVIEAREILDQGSAKKFVQTIVYYPLVLGVNLILTLVAGVIGLEGGCMPLICAIMDSCWCFQGLIDAILYGYNSIVREEMQAYLRKSKRDRAASLIPKSLAASLIPKSLVSSSLISSDNLSHV